MKKAVPAARRLAPEDARDVVFGRLADGGEVRRDRLDGHRGLVADALRHHELRLERDRRVGPRALEDFAEQLVLAARRAQQDALVGRVDAEVGDEREEVVGLALDDDERPGADGLDRPGGIELHLDACAERSVGEHAHAGAVAVGVEHRQGRGGREATRRAWGPRFAAAR